MQTLYTIRGTVVTGDHIGERLGYPTANLATKEAQKVKRGVYAGLVERAKTDTTHKAGIVIGAQDSHQPPKIEAHLLNFTDDLYGEILTFHLKKYLREVLSYENQEDLKKAIAHDITMIKKMDL